MLTENVKEYDLIVVGGGAAGLMAAGTAASNGLKVVLLEKMEKPARKIRITGKGRCNLTNIKPEEEFLEKVQTNRDFFRPAYEAFDNRALVRFFERKGVRLETERGGRVFPKSGKAWDIVFGDRVRGVEYRTKRGFLRKIEAPAVVLCTGGASYPATGSTGDGYALAHAAGHGIEPVRPSLVPLETSLPDRTALEGLQLRNVRVALLVDGERVTDEFGEMAFSSRGVEGAVVLRMSRQAVDALIEGHKVELSLDLKPALDAETVRERIAREKAALPAGGVMSDLLRKLMPREMMIPVARMVGTHPKRLLSSFTPAQEEELIRVLKDFRIPVSDYRPFTEAIVTAGGVSVEEVNPRTMESQRIRGLYFAGEVLDLDANTGGYNLQIAFSTGRLAGMMRHEA